MSIPFILSWQARLGVNSPLVLFNAFAVANYKQTLRSATKQGVSWNEIKRTKWSDLDLDVSDFLDFVKFLKDTRWGSFSTTLSSNDFLRCKTLAQIANSLKKVNVSVEA